MEVRNVHAFPWKAQLFHKLTAGREVLSKRGVTVDAAIYQMAMRPEEPMRSTSASTEAASLPQCLSRVVAAVGIAPQTQISRRSTDIETKLKVGSNRKRSKSPRREHGPPAEATKAPILTPLQARCRVAVRSLTPRAILAR